MQRRAVLIGLAGCGMGLLGCGTSPQPANTPAAPTPAPLLPLLPGWQPGALVKMARRIGRGVAATDGAYFWRSENEVLFVRPGGTAGLFQVSTLAVGSGKEALLSVLNQRLRGRLRGSRVRIATPSHPQGETHFQLPPVSLSPDGRWLLWYGGLQWTAAALESTDELHWRQPSPLQNAAVWLRDGRYWAELEADAREGRDFLRRVIIHDLQNPLVDRTIETPALEAGDVLGFTPEGRLLVRHPIPIIPAEEALFTEVDLTSEQGALRPYPVRLPSPGTVLETTLSPTGDRLAWVLAESGGKQPRRALWLSHANGEGLTLVGSAPEAANETENTGLQLVQWLPQGDGLSFVAGNALYTLSFAQ